MIITIRIRFSKINNISSMIKFKLYSNKKDPKKMTDKEALKAKYRDTSGLNLSSVGTKVGATAGALRGLHKSLGRKGVFRTPISMGINSALGAGLGYLSGSLADVGVKTLGYGGRKTYKSASRTAKAINNEVKKFSDSNKDKLPSNKSLKNAALVGTGTAAAGGVGSLIGMANVAKDNGAEGYRDIYNKVINKVKNTNALNKKQGVSLLSLDGIRNIKDAAEDGLIDSMTKNKGSYNDKMKLMKKAGKKGARVAALTALSAGLAYTMDKKRKANKQYNKELKSRKIEAANNLKRK